MKPKRKSQPEPAYRNPRLSVERRVTFWGIYDKTSWIGGSPLLFDRNYQPKEAFYAMVRTAQGKEK